MQYQNELLYICRIPMWLAVKPPTCRAGCTKGRAGVEAGILACNLLRKQQIYNRYVLQLASPVLNGYMMK